VARSGACPSWPSVLKRIRPPRRRFRPSGTGSWRRQENSGRTDATGPRDADNLLFADRLGSCPAQSAKNEPFIGDFRLYFREPKTSRNTTLRSSSARAQSPVKLEPCMMASVLGFRSASFFKFPAVSGV